MQALRWIPDQQINTKEFLLDTESMLFPMLCVLYIVKALDYQMLCALPAQPVPPG